MTVPPCYYPSPASYTDPPSAEAWCETGRGVRAPRGRVWRDDEVIITRRGRWVAGMGQGSRRVDSLSIRCRKTFEMIG